MGDKISTSQPELRWTAIPGALQYRLQLQVRTPEAGTAWSVDTFIQGQSYRLSRPATRTTASVKALISVGCEKLTQEDLEAQPAAFFVDVTALCPAPEAVAFDAASREVRWTASPKYHSVEGIAYRLSDGRMLEKHLVSTGSRLVLKATDASVLALRPSCAEADGQAYLLPLPAASASGTSPSGVK